MTEITNEPHDEYRYNGVRLSPNSLKFFVAAIRYYVSLLEKQLQNIQQNEFIKELLSIDGDSLYGIQLIEKEIKRYSNGIIGFEKLIQEDSFWGIPLIHRTVRELKSIGHLYLTKLRKSRDEFLREGKTSILALEAIDTALAQMEEKIKGGVFANATLVPLFVDSSVLSASVKPEATPPDTQEIHKPLLTPIFGIEVLDTELNKRCIPLLQHLSSNLTSGATENSTQEEKFDTIVREAVSIVEHRIRITIGADTSRSGLELVSDAFARTPIQIRVSNDRNEQEGVHALFRGFFGFIRNPFSHRLIPTGRNRAIQILGMADYLLFLIESAEKLAKEATTS